MAAHLLPLPRVTPAWGRRGKLDNGAAADSSLQVMHREAFPALYSSWSGIGVTSGQCSLNRGNFSLGEAQGNFLHYSNPPGTRRSSEAPASCTGHLSGLGRTRQAIGNRRKSLTGEIFLAAKRKIFLLEATCLLKEKLYALFLVGECHLSIPTVSLQHRHAPGSFCKG